MKKIKIIVVVILSLITLNYVGVYLMDNLKEDPKAELLEKAEDALIKSMNDSDSYEFISFEEDYTYSDSLRKSDEQFFKEEKIDLNNDYHLLTFRGKNKLGAKIIDKVIVKSSSNVFLELIDAE